MEPSWIASVHSVLLTQLMLHITRHQLSSHPHGEAGKLMKVGSKIHSFISHMANILTGTPPYQLLLYYICEVDPHK